jgi:thioredoxin
MARQMSPLIVGRVVEGIWHTSIVVHNKEYYFQGGTFGDAPKSTPFGIPLREIPLGNTEITKQELDDYVVSIADQFSANTYDIFQNNCNHFSNNLSEFLVGETIPTEYLNQAKEFDHTPIGNFIKSMNEAMKAQVQSAHGGLSQFSQATPARPFQAPVGSSDVQHITTAEQYVQFLTSNERAIIDFNATWCGPCKVIKPVFESLATQYKGQIAFAAVDIDKARDLAGELGIRSIPVFLAFRGEKEFGKIVGADQNKLRSLLADLAK